MALRELDPLCNTAEMAVASEFKQPKQKGSSGFRVVQSNKVAQTLNLRPNSSAPLLFVTEKLRVCATVEANSAKTVEF